MQEPGFRIKEVWLFTATENDVEGLIGFRNPDGQWLPLVCADPEAVASRMKIAKAIAEGSNRTVRLLKFCNLEIISEDICKNNP